MNVLMMCPANVVTGGTESIHEFASKLNENEDVNVKILYFRCRGTNPQPDEYKEYNVDYVTNLLPGYKDIIIFPEIWANEVNNPKYADCLKVVHWLGVDVYYWNNPVSEYNKFLDQKNVLHLTQMQYGTDNLLKLGVNPKLIYHISDVPNKIFFEEYREVPRNNVVLFNPNLSKLTDFQRTVMGIARKEGLEFRPLENLTREQMAQTMRSAKLYIDFGVFSGRERIPREAALCGCCVITSKSGCAGYFNDVALSDKWKFETVPENIPKIIDTMKYVLANYYDIKSEFSTYKQSLIKDRERLPKDCKKLAKVFATLPSYLRNLNEI